METIPSGTTHSRFNKKSRKVNAFRITAAGEILIWNKKWEPYTGNSSNLIPVSTDSNGKISLNGLESSVKNKSSKVYKTQDTKEPKYDNQLASLQEDVMDYVPTPVLRELVRHYKTADVVEVEINVKTTHTIKG